MNNEERKSHRLNRLLTMALDGKTLQELEQKCDSWGISPNTKKSYLNAVSARLKKRVEWSG